MSNPSLNAAIILKKAQNLPLALEVFEEIDSTNTYLLKQAKKNQAREMYAVLAECQTEGRGRNGKIWQSPAYENIYLSVLVEYPKSVQTLAGLSLAVGVSLIKTLGPKTGIAELKLKWPNDLYYKRQKLAGILIETAQLQKESCKVVIGIGLNVNAEKKNETITQPWTSLKQMTAQIWNRNDLAVALLIQLYADWALFKKEGFKAFREDFLNYDLIYNQPIALIEGERILTGIGRGVNEAGALLCETETELIPVQVGIVSLRL